LAITRPIRNKNTAERYEALIGRFNQEFGDREINQITSDEALSYLNRITDGNKPYTRRIRYAQLSSFFNFIRNNIDPESTNPSDSLMIRKIYRERIKTIWEVVGKETVDEIIFRTTNPGIG
jgi:integrase